MHWKLVATYAVVLVVATTLVYVPFGMGMVDPAWFDVGLRISTLLAVAAVFFVLARRHPQRVWRHAAAALAAFLLIEFVLVLPAILSQGVPLDSLPRLLWKLPAMLVGVAIGRRFPASTTDLGGSA